jgi:hypothetical protein
MDTDVDGTSDAEAQRLSALRLANDVRRRRAVLKRRVAAGELAVRDVILAPPAEASTMTVGELLRSQPRGGRVRCTALLRQVPLSEEKPIGSMTVRQRRAVAALLGPGR